MIFQPRPSRSSRSSNEPMKPFSGLFRLEEPGDPRLCNKPPVSLQPPELLGSGRRLLHPSSTSLLEQRPGRLARETRVTDGVLERDRVDDEERAVGIDRRLEEVAQPPVARWRGVRLARRAALADAAL